MCPYNGYYDDFEDAEELNWERSQAFQKLLNNHRREERHHDRFRELRKDRHHRNPWDWDNDDDDDYDTYVDDEFDQYYEDFRNA